MRGEQLGHRMDRADPHFIRIAAGDRNPDMAAQRGQPAARDLRLLHDHRSRGPVRQLAGIACRNRTPFGQLPPSPEGRGKPREISQSGAGRLPSSRQALTRGRRARRCRDRSLSGSPPWGRSRRRTARQAAPPPCAAATGDQGYRMCRRDMQLAERHHAQESRKGIAPPCRAGVAIPARPPKPPCLDPRKLVRLMLTDPSMSRLADVQSQNPVATSRPASKRRIPN